LLCLIDLLIKWFIAFEFDFFLFKCTRPICTFKNIICANYLLASKGLYTIFAVIYAKWFLLAIDTSTVEHIGQYQVFFLCDVLCLDVVFLFLYLECQQEIRSIQRVADWFPQSTRVLFVLPFLRLWQTKDWVFELLW